MRLCAEVYQTNSGATFETDDIVYGLKEAAKLITDEVVAEEASGAAYVQSSRSK